MINLVASLMALLLVFDAVCGEKEQGTFKLMLANSVPRDLILLSKWLGGYVALSSSFLVAVLGGITYVYLSGALHLNAEELVRLGSLVGLSLLYIAVCFSIGMFISTLTHKASTALLVALVTWVAWLLVVPNLAPLIAKGFTLVPSRQSLEAEKSGVDREVLLRLRRLERNEKMWTTGAHADKLRREIREQGGLESASWTVSVSAC